MAMSLTHAQAELLGFIERFQADNDGVSPSFEEMKQELGLHSKSGVHRLLAALIERGRIEKLPNRARALVVLKDEPLAGIPTRALLAELARRGEENRRAA